MRIRTIKPEFWTHPIMARQEPEIRLLALALLNYADDEGYFLADPMLVRGACCPFVESSSTIRRWLARLSDVGWIALSNETPHGVIGRVVNFEEHQKIDRARPSQIKTYWFDDESTNDRRMIDESSLLERKGKEQGKERIREQGTSFEEFWKAWPRKEGKEAARKAWPKVADNLPAILEALSWQRVSENWTKEGGRFIPLPATYLNGRRWEDEKPAPYTPGRAPQHSPSNAAHGSDPHKYDHLIVRSEPHD